nr:hypothetical protein [Candidatus Sigynarchaeota archaeon]
MLLSSRWDRSIFPKNKRQQAVLDGLVDWVMATCDFDGLLAHERDLR